jgi:glyoxylase-like metal-dependent hydrolase (beta-lactamase superfamily II)
VAWVLRLGARTHLLLYPGLTGYPDSVVGLLELEGCRVLVDTGSGSPWSNTALAAALAYLGVRGGVRYAVLTHGHLPNAGGAHFAHSTLGAIVAAMEPDASWVERGDRERTAAEEFGLPFNPAPVGLRLSEGPLPGCGGARVIHTPGHTPGSLTLIHDDPAAGLVAFVGDALGRLSRRWGSSERDWWRSAERIASLDPRVLCTSAQCMSGEAARRFIEEALARGPEWVERAGGGEG